MRLKVFLVFFMAIAMVGLHAQASLPNIISADARTNCVSSTNGFMNVAVGGGVSPYTFFLRDNTGALVSTNSDGKFTNMTLGATYSITVIDQNNDSSSRVTTVHSAPANQYLTNVIDVSCHGDSDGRAIIQGLTIENGPFQFSVDGSPLQITPVFFDLRAGTHSIRVVDQFGCDTTFQISVANPAAATLSINAPDTSIGVGEAYPLSINFSPYLTDSIKSSSWSPAEGLSCSDCQNPVVTSYAPSTDYTLTVTYNNGCTVSATAKVMTHSVFSVYVPNVFSPNNDGHNDVFTPYGTGVKDMTLKVFDRWGEKVFESNDIFEGWDGNSMGTQALPGIYCYVMDVTYLNNQKAFKRGSVTLMR